MDRSKKNRGRAMLGGSTTNAAKSKKKDHHRGLFREELRRAKTMCPRK